MLRIQWFLPLTYWLIFHFPFTFGCFSCKIQSSLAIHAVNFAENLFLFSLFQLVCHHLPVNISVCVHADNVGELLGR